MVIVRFFIKGYRGKGMIKVINKPIFRPTVRTTVEMLTANIKKMKRACCTVLEERECLQADWFLDVLGNLNLGYFSFFPINIF